MKWFLLTLIGALSFFVYFFVQHDSPTVPQERRIQEIEMDKMKPIVSSPSQDKKSNDIEYPERIERQTDSAVQISNPPCGQSVNPEEIELARNLVWNFLTAGNSDPGLLFNELCNQIEFDNEEYVAFKRELCFRIKSLYTKVTIDPNQRMVVGFDFYRNASPKIVEWVEISGCAACSSKLITAPEVQNEFNQRGWILPQDAFQVAHDWIERRYPNFAQRNFILDTYVVDVSCAGEIKYRFAWLEKPRPEQGELAIFNNRIHLWLNPETREVTSYGCSGDIRLVVREQPWVAKEEAIDAVRRKYPWCFEGYVPGSGERAPGWAPDGSNWRSDLKVSGPTLCVYPKPGSINEPIVYWYIRAVPEQGEIMCDCFIDAQTGEFIDSPLKQWSRYNEKDSQGK